MNIVMALHIRRISISPFKGWKHCRICNYREEARKIWAVQSPREDTSHSKISVRFFNMADLLSRGRGEEEGSVKALVRGFFIECMPAGLGLSGAHEDVESYLNAFTSVDVRP